MKKILSILFAVFFVTSCTNAQTDVEKEAIKKVIQTGYVDGLLNYGDTEITKDCFYPGFFITTIENNQVSHYTIYNWIDNVEKGKASGNVPESKFTVKFVQIDVTEHAASAKVEMYKDGEVLTFTDYLLLYKFEEGWKIVQKIYYRHPEEKK